MMKRFNYSAMFVLLSFISLANETLACASSNVNFERLLMSLPNEAFDWGAEGLSVAERQDLLATKESATYRLEKEKKTQAWLIRNKYARDSVFRFRIYIASKAAYLCVATSYGQNHRMECWQGRKKVALLPPLGIKDFLKHAEQFSAKEQQALQKTYPIALFFDQQNTIAGSINLWMQSPLEEADVHDKMYLIWQPKGKGHFFLSSKPMSLPKPRCSEHMSHTKPQKRQVNVEAR